MLLTSLASASCDSIGVTPQFLDAVLIHEARVHVAELALLGALRRIRRPVDDLAHGRFGLFAQDQERAVARLVGRDLGAWRATCR